MLKCNTPRQLEMQSITKTVDINTLFGTYDCDKSIVEGKGWRVYNYSYKKANS